MNQASEKEVDQVRAALKELWAVKSPLIRTEYGKPCISYRDLANKTGLAAPTIGRLARQAGLKTMRLAIGYTVLIPDSLVNPD